MDSSRASRNKLAVRSEKAFTNQGDNEAATTDYELTDLEKHNSPNLGAPVQNTSTQAHIELAQSPYNAPLGSNEHSLAELSAHQHDTGKWPTRLFQVALFLTWELAIK